MKTFSKLSKIGPGIELYSINKRQCQETLYRATTGEYILATIVNSKSRSKKIAVIEESKAILWCIQSGQCESDTDFYRKIWTTLCQPVDEGTHKIIRTPIPKNNLDFARVLELLQLSVFREAVIGFADSGRIERVRLDQLDFLLLCSWINVLMTLESFDYNVVIASGPSESFQRIDSSSTHHEYEVTWGSCSMRAKCGYALAPFQYPIKFQSCSSSQGVWIELIEFRGDLDDNFLGRIAESAYGMLFSSILLYETVLFISKDPTQIPPDNGLLDY